MVGWHHRLNGHEFEWTPGVGDGQGGLECCSPWGHKKWDLTEQLNWVKVKVAQQCLTLCDSVGCRLAGSSLHVILQARILEWEPFPSPGYLLNPRIKPRCPALQVDSIPSEPPGKKGSNSFWFARSYTVYCNFSNLLLLSKTSLRLRVCLCYNKILFTKIGEEPDLVLESNFANTISWVLLAPWWPYVKFCQRKEAYQTHMYN